MNIATVSRANRDNNKHGDTTRTDAITDTHQSLARPFLNKFNFTSRRFTARLLPRKSYALSPSDFINDRPTCERVPMYKSFRIGCSRGG